MKNKSTVITLIVILFVLAISLIFGMVLLINKNFNIIFDFNLSSKNMKIVDSYEAINNDINKVDFNLYSSDVEIKSSTDDKLKIEYYSSKDKNSKIKVTDNIISLNEADSHAFCFGICHNQRKVILYIPSKYVLSINIITRSGDIKSSINLDESLINIKTNSGDVILKNTTDLSIVTTSGDILIEKANKAKLNTTSGDIVINGEISNLDTKTTSGDVLINKINNQLNMNTTSGDINVNELNIKNNSMINTTSGDILIKNNISDSYIEFNTKSGDSRINKSNRKSDVVLTVRTTSGDISVN